MVTNLLKSGSLVLSIFSNSRVRPTKKRNIRMQTLSMVLLYVNYTLASLKTTYTNEKFNCL